MITIDFEIDEEVLQAELEENIAEEDSAYFVSTMFIMPVLFQIDEIVFFNFNSSNAPIMSLASAGLIAVKKLKFTEKKEYNIIEGPGIFEFNLLNPIHVKVDF